MKANVILFKNICIFLCGGLFLGFVVILKVSGNNASLDATDAKLACLGSLIAIEKFLEKNERESRSVNESDLRKLLRTLGGDTLDRFFRDEQLESIRKTIERSNSVDITVEEFELLIQESKLRYDRISEK